MLIDKTSGDLGLLSRAGTIRADVIPRSATCRPSASSDARLCRRKCESTSPPPGATPVPGWFQVPGPPRGHVDRREDRLYSGNQRGAGDDAPASAALSVRVWRASLTLLLAAFSAFAFAPAMPRAGGAAPVERPIVVLRSDRGQARKQFSPRGPSGVAGTRPAAPGRGVHGRTVVAASMIGIVSERGVGAPALRQRRTPLTSRLHGRGNFSVSRCAWRVR